MSFNINDKVALVTGGASGLGYAFVQQLLKNDCKGVAIIDSNAKSGLEALDKLKKQFEQNRFIFINCDVTDSNALEGAFKQTVETYKQLDIVINNAGVYDEENWEKTVSVNLNGCINGTLLALEKYLPRYKVDNDGVIINVGEQQKCAWHSLFERKQKQNNAKIKMQLPEHVAENLMMIIKEGKSGSVWVVAKGEPAYEESFPERNYS